MMHHKSVPWGAGPRIGLYPGSSLTLDTKETSERRSPWGALSTRVAVVAVALLAFLALMATWGTNHNARTQNANTWVEVADEARVQSWRLLYLVEAAEQGDDSAPQEIRVVLADMEERLDRLCLDDAQLAPPPAELLGRMEEVREAWHAEVEPAALDQASALAPTVRAINAELDSIVGEHRRQEQARADRFRNISILITLLMAGAGGGLLLLMGRFRHKERAASQLQDEVERNRALLAANPDLMFLLDDKGTYLDVRSQDEGALLVPPTELLGKRMDEVLPPVLARACMAAIGEVLRTERTVPLEYALPIGEEVRSFEARLAGCGSRQVLMLVRETTELRAASEQARSAELVMDNAGESIFWVDREARLVYANDTACRMLGYTHEEFLELRIQDIDAEADPDRWTAFWDLVRTEGPQVVETVQQTKDGTRIPVEISVMFAVLGGRELLCAFCRDIRDRKLAQAELVQGRKMEAIGRLAGGVAHDFNNILTVILGYAGFVGDELPEGGQVREDLRTVVDAAKRAERLVSQLLAFSRRRPVEPKILDIDELVEETARMLSRVLGEHIVLDTELGLGGWTTSMDPTAFDQVLMNLAVNARDAMPRGGSLTLTTRRVRADHVGANPARPGLVPGEYAVLSVSDTGTGMDELQQSRCFEPFFSTKPEGEGTGLGLATCMGLVKQAEGFIYVESTPGAGTTFSVYLRRADGGTRFEGPETVESPTGRGQGTVLVVEDLRGIREMARRTLRAQGYRVLTARDGKEALEVAASTDLDLVITDVVMPHMGGVELVERLEERFPHLKIVFMSGFSDHPSTHLTEGSCKRFLTKPFEPSGLLAVVSETLDEGDERHA